MRKELLVAGVVMLAIPAMFIRSGFSQTKPPSASAAPDKFFDSKGTRIRFVEQGSGEPIILIHDYTSSIERSWTNTGVLQNLAKDHRVITLDLRGHGKSDKPTTRGSYGIELSQDVVRLMDQLAIPRAHIVGHAFGGTVNAKLLTIAADRYKTAILTASAGSRTWTALNEKAAEDEAVELTQGVPFRTVILRIAPSDRPKPTEETIREQSRVMVSVNDPVALAALVRSRRELVVTNAQMAAVRVPTLAIVGGVD